MSLDKFKAIINEKYFPVFKSMCSDEKEIASNGANATSMDDVTKLSAELANKYSCYQLRAIIELWTKVKTAPNLNNIVDYLLKAHFEAVNDYPNPTTSYIYTQRTGGAALFSLEKAIDQSLITGDLKLKVELGLLENYKKREGNKYTIPFEQIPVSDMIPWKKLEVKTTSAGFFKPAADEKHVQPAPAAAATQKP